MSTTYTYPYWYPTCIHTGMSPSYEATPCPMPNCPSTPCRYLYAQSLYLASPALEDDMSDLELDSSAPDTPLDQGPLSWEDLVALESYPIDYSSMPIRFAQAFQSSLARDKARANGSLVAASPATSTTRPPSSPTRQRRAPVRRTEPSVDQAWMEMAQRQIAILEAQNDNTYRMNHRSRLDRSWIGQAGFLAERSEVTLELPDIREQWDEIQARKPRPSYIPKRTVED